MVSAMATPDYDAIIVGAGFGGCYMLHELRKRGFKCLVIDEAGDLGGVWYWNCYDGARVDSKIPLYEFSDERIWKDWVWTEKYPGREEIQKYFAHVESKLDLKKDVQFNSRVVKAEFEEKSSQWRVVTADKVERTANYFILCTGFASKPYIPDFEGLESFKGISCHTSKWPQGGIDFSGKTVGVVGNGSSGLQVIQEIAPLVKSMTVFQRNPTYALPMRQAKFTEHDQDKTTYPAIMAKRLDTFAGIDREFEPRSATTVSDKEREEFFERIWEEGGLAFWLANYMDVIMDQDANKYAYDFWRSKVLHRIKDPKIAEVLAPKTPPYFFGTKRATLEQRYYEVYNQDNVELVNSKAIPIQKIVPEGVITEDGKLRKLDVLVLATGFDSVTGGILAIDIKGRQGQSLASKWAEGTWTNMGLTTKGFPNMFFLYGPQGPTSFCNGPTCAEVQGSWIASTLDHLRSSGAKEIDTSANAETNWQKLVNDIGSATLLPHTQSEYMGTNIPGKPKEMLNYLGGLPQYRKFMATTVEEGYSGFVIQ